MKASEYFKKYGLKGSREHLDWMVRVEARSDIHGDFMADLKRLVEIHELVKEHGGLERAKMYAESKYTAPEVVECMKQAVTDVESCQ